MSANPMTPRGYLAIAAIALVAATLTLNRLGAADVCGGNEAVEGVFLQQMVERGVLLFPLENGREPMYKPPLFHWTAVALDRLLGFRKVTAFNLRLPAALYAVAGVVLTMAFADGLLGLEGSVLCGLVLVGSYQYVSEGRIGRVDMTLTFFETLALLSFLWWLPERGSDGGDIADARNDGMRYLFALALGLAVLAKGPVGAMLPILAIAIFLVLERRWRTAGALFTPGSAILAAALSSSWYLACLFGQRYGFLHRQIGSENIGRFFGALGSMAPWYYVKPLFLNSAPLSLLAPIAVFYGLRLRRASGAASAETPQTDRVADAVGLLAIFWVVTVVFFTLAAYKRRAYLLPLWPPAAVLIAWWLTYLGADWRGRIFRLAVAATCCGLIVFNLLFIPAKQIRECKDDSFREAAAQINRVVGPDEPLYAYGIEVELAPLLFYLDRDAPPLEGRLGDAPPGYVITQPAIWAAHKSEALDLEPVLTAGSGPAALVLLRRGKAYAQARF